MKATVIHFLAVVWSFFPTPLLTEPAYLDTPVRRHMRTHLPNAHDQTRKRFASLSTLLLLAIPLLIGAHAARAQTETVFNDFCSQANCTDGAYGLSRLTSDSNGNLYGTTFEGDLCDAGTVFELSPNGRGGWDRATLYNFCSVVNCTDGAFPFYSNVIFDPLGNLY